MESGKVDDIERVPNEASKVLEMGRVSEETKGTQNIPGESVMQPVTHGN